MHRHIASARRHGYRQARRQLHSQSRALRQSAPQHVALVCGPAIVLPTLHNLAACEAIASAQELQRRVTVATLRSERHPPDAGLLHRLKRARRKARRALRMLARATQLLLTFGPLAALYPVARILKSFGFGGVGTSGSNLRFKDFDAEALSSPAAQDDSAVAEWYLNLCLRAVESSGAAVIKLMQWASSRPDLFGRTFCDVFSKLQDSTTPHPWKHTERLLKRTYGDRWEETISIGEVLGSGCIGQVYEGRVADADGVDQKVAIKCMHPGVRNNIDADLDLLYFFADVSERTPFGVGKQLRWLDLPGVVDEFHRLLIHQLDFRTEAENLERFNKNFENDKHVVFPSLVPGFPAREDILIESFVDGLPFAKWVSQNRDNAEKRKLMCDVGVRAVCEMIFVHNFIHGDLHPGNIFVSTDGNKFILLDTGMAAEYDDHDHERIVDILTAFIKMDGQTAGELLIKDSNARTRDDDKVLHEAEYVAKIKALTDECKYSRDTYLMKNLGEYISRIFDAAQQHHVLMNPAFVSCSLAVKILEGVAFELDEDCEIWRVANPIILQAEITREAAKTARKLGMEGVMNAVTRKFYELVYANK